MTCTAGMGKVRSFQDEIMAHPLVQDVLTANPNRLSDLDAIIAKADTGKDLAATRHILQKDYINPSFAPGSKTDDEQVADLARGIHDVIDDHFVPDELKATYARDKVIKEALSREDLKLPKATEAGSPTFARLAASAAMGGMGGEGLGLASGQDPGEALQTAAMTAGAGLVGGIGGRLGSRAINKGLAGPQARLAQLLGRIPESTSEGAMNIAPRVAQAASRIPQIAQTQQAAAPDIQPPVSAAPQQIPQMEGVDYSGGQMNTAPIQPTPTQPPLPKDPEAQQAVFAEQAMPQEQVQAAKSATLAPFQDKIREKLLRDWRAWDNPYKTDFDQFYEQARNATNNFDPKSENTAKIIGGPNYKEYLKSYNVALNMQSLGKNLSEALGYWGLPGLLGGAEAKEKHDQLVNTLYTAMTGDMKEPDKTTRASIEKRLRTLRQQRLSESGQKRELMGMLQNEYGVRFDLLNQYGLM